MLIFSLEGAGKAIVFCKIQTIYLTKNATTEKGWTIAFNHLFGLNGTCTCAQDCVYGYGTQTIVNLIFQEFQVLLGLPLWQTTSYAGRPQVCAITLFSRLYKFNVPKNTTKMHERTKEKHL